MSALVKICGLTRAEDVDAAVAAGADLIGLILVPWSPRAIGREEARRLRERVPAGIGVVGVFVDEDPDTIEELVDDLALDHVQLHGSEPDAVVARFGARAIKAHRLPTAAPLAGDTVLLDRAFDSAPDRDVLHDHWAAAREACRRRRGVLAGSLTVENVPEAIRAARPWAVDGVRGTEAAPGVKDHRRLRAVVRAAQEAP